MLVNPDGRLTVVVPLELAFATRTIKSPTWADAGIEMERLVVPVAPDDAINCGSFLAPTTITGNPGIIILQIPWLKQTQT